jgi:hypothetical protein
MHRPTASSPKPISGRSNAKTSSVRSGYDDQVAVEALVRFSEEESKHQELFRQIEKLCAEVMPPGYQFTASPNDVAMAVLSKSTWAVLGLTCHIELFTLAHYKHSSGRTPEGSAIAIPSASRAGRERARLQTGRS